MKIITKVKKHINTSIFQKNVFTLQVEKQTYYKPIKKLRLWQQSFFQV